MITNSDIAKQIDALMQEIYRQLEESVEMVKNKCSSEEHAAYKKAVGRIVSRIVFDALAPLYEKNPALKPPNWDDRT